MKPLKQVIVVRKDLKLSKGKLAVQVAHASVSSLGNTDNNIVSKWSSTGSKKVVLVVNGVDDIWMLHEKCKKFGISHTVISDAGLTEVPSGTVTCIGIGPDYDEKINKITGSLPLLH